jgi:hypothetical protein
MGNITDDILEWRHGIKAFNNVGKHLMIEYPDEFATGEALIARTNICATGEICKAQSGWRALSCCRAQNHPVVISSEPKERVVLLLYR